ncbi:transcription factor [Epithele typhae]|uniref:transcription factor n=1 Tax=Epithele typhae TaxID=378194 RepID=UPI0020075DB3|nr:transcription factor [Epithele typhae]KAH9917919.1 transcription factor [Epithele typhae]
MVMARAEPKIDEEHIRRAKRAALKELNVLHTGEEPSKTLDSSLKRHTALIKRMRQSLGAEHRDQVLKDIDTLSLEKYVDEIVGAAAEGVLKCKTEKDVWSAVEVISALHRRFPKAFTSSIVSSLSVSLAPPSKAALATLSLEQREKEDSSRITRQRPILRVCGRARPPQEKSGGEWVMKTIRDLLSNDPSLSSLPLLLVFLKSYSSPFLGIVPPEEVAHSNGTPSVPFNEAEELVEKEIRDRFKKMCEGYFDNVAKKLVMEHNRLQDQDRRNHEAYIRSGEIFEDRQQAYEKMTKNYEKLLASCQKQLYLPMPTLKTASQKSESIQIGVSTGSSILGGDGDEGVGGGGKWEDEEERRFFEEIPDIKDYVPRSVLGLDGEGDDDSEDGKEKERQDKERVEEEVRKLEEELAGMKVDGEGKALLNGNNKVAEDEDLEVDNAPTPTPGTPKESPATTPQLAPQGPSQLLTALLARLPDATNRSLVDQAAVDFAFLNSKAARKRLVKFMTQIPKSRSDLLPHYSRFIAILNRYMPDLGTDIVAALDEEFHYLQRKKKVVKELSEVRMRNITFLSNLTKFRVVPAHKILHAFKVCLDDFSGTNVENIAMLLEGCGRFLLRSEETHEPFSKMIELMRRKQSMQHFDQRQLLLLENAYYQCNPPERAARQVKERTPVELFIRHLVYDVLAKKTIDKVFKLLRKLDWNNSIVVRTLYKVFTKPWKLKYSHIPLLAMLTYDLQLVDQVLEDIRRGLETNLYSMNQRRIASIKFLGELYIYRLVSSGIIFHTFWSLVTFGHPEGRPLPGQLCNVDMPDDYFRIRLVCVLLDTCGIRGSSTTFLTFFQLYVHSKDPLPMDVEFMLTDSLEAVRPKLSMFMTFEEAAVAVDEMFNTAFQNAGVAMPDEVDGGDDSGEDSGGDDDDDDKRRGEDEDEEDDRLQPDSPIDERAPSPEAVLLKSSTTNENLGPTEDDDAEFAKELAKLVTDTSADSRKVDKKTALALWDTTLPPVMRRKQKVEDDDDESAAEGADGPNVMNFTLFTKRGNKQQTRQIAIPAESMLAVQTRTAQMQDKVEQQQLKRLVLNYEQREGAEEVKALEARNRQGPIKIRLAG